MKVVLLARLFAQLQSYLIAILWMYGILIKQKCSETLCDRSGVLRTLWNIYYAAFSEND